MTNWKDTTLLEAGLTTLVAIICACVLHGCAKVNVPMKFPDQIAQSSHLQHFTKGTCEPSSM